MGVGKTTAGRCLAERLDVPFLDLDQVVERASGRTVPDIFQTDGEIAFRQQETSALREVLAGEPVVLALGGGTLHHANNRMEICSTADLVCLDMPFAEIQERIVASDGGRPLWSQGELLFQNRLAGYRQSQHCINVSGLTVNQVVDSIERVLSCA